jgi:outer membrane protein OmpA-like peptidoglycan-associated protein
MKPITLSAGLFALTFVTAAHAQDSIPPDVPYWKGFYIGGNVGGAWNSTCNSWSLNGPALTDPALVTAFDNRNCPNNGVFIGGAQIGYNFQYERWVWGFGMDYDQWSAKNRSRSFVYTPTAGSTFPAGTAAFNGKVSPNGFGILGPRVGYAVGNVLPYVRFGGVYAGGSRTSTATFTEAGDATPDAYFSGSKNFKSSGFGAGAGMDVLLSDNWFLRAEYTYIKLGKGTNTATQCTSAGTAAGTAICAEFGTDALELNNIHNSFTANIVRVGINYKFGSRPYVAPVVAAAPAYVAPPPPPTPPAPPPPPPCHAPAGFQVDANCHIIEQSIVVRAIDFEYNSTHLTAPARQTLDEVAGALQTQPELQVEIQGYTDSTGSDAYNLGLSQRRADAVRAYLIDKGLSASALTAKGYGKGNPIASNSTAEGRAENRRVAFQVTNAPEHVKVVTKDASPASTEAAEQGPQSKPKNQN